MQLANLQAGLNALAMQTHEAEAAKVQMQEQHALQLERLQVDHEKDLVEVHNAAKANLEEVSCTAKLDLVRPIFYSLAEQYECGCCKGC